MRRSFLLAALVCVLAGCSFAPQYEVPTTAPAPDAFKEMGPWTLSAQPETTEQRPWWEIMNDPRLDALEQRLENNPPRLAAAIARLEQSLALTRHTRADLAPQVSAEASAVRQRALTAGGAPATGNLGSVGLSATYEIDLWGRVRNAVAAGQAESDATKSDLAAVRLGLQAELAENYLRMRNMDSRIALLDEAIASYRTALELVSVRLNGGAASEVDAARAQAQFSAAQAQREQRAADRALYEHAIAALVGEQASVFSIPANPELPRPIAIPVAAPSTLLQRRPDVAAAERRVAAANARIGVARAAYFPSISLGLSGGISSSSGDLLAVSHRVWALGPVGALLPLFDGGRRSADVDRTRAEFDEASSNYRQIALDAFKNVEDQLTLLNRLAAASAQQEVASKAAVRANEIADVLYKEGAADFLQVVVAQTIRLQNQGDAIDLQARRLIASVDLVRSMGGPW